MILPDMLPQFWHCTVRFSAPVRGDWNANVPLVWVEDKFGGTSKRENGRTVGTAGEQEEHCDDGFWSLNVEL
jgi:hypothetical protein